MTVPHKAATGSDGNIMPLHRYKKLFPRETKEQLAATNIKLKMYNHTTITQLGTCKVKMEHNNKQKICTLFVVPGNRQALLAMLDIEILNTVTTDCNTIGTKETDRDPTCYTNTAIMQGAGCEQCYTNTRQEIGRPGRCYTNTNSNPDLNLTSTDKPVVSNNEIEYFLPGTNQDNDREQVLKSQNNYKEILKMVLVE